MVIACCIVLVVSYVLVLPSIICTYRHHVCQTEPLATGGGRAVLIIVQADLAHVGGALGEGPFTGTCRGVGGWVSWVPE